MTSIEIAYPLTGRSLPHDHGYLLCAGVKGCLEGIGKLSEISHFIADQTIGIYVTARRSATGQFELKHGASLRIRLGTSLIPNFLPLAGRLIRVGNDNVRLGVPAVHALLPAAALYARLVTIKGFQTPDDFLGAARRQLTDLQLDANVELKLGVHQAGPREGQPLRRVLKIRDKTIVGFDVEANCATPESSLRLQSVGLGGRRHFGAGIFLPKPNRNGGP